MKVKSFLMAVVFSLFNTLCAQNVGLAVMATGKYIQFVEPLIESAEKFFCKGHNITYFIFTDGKDEKLSNRKNVVLIHQDKLGWPYDTMMRFKTYAKHATIFKGQDYVYACDADMLFVSNFGDEIFGEHVAVIHPGFYNKKREQYTYDVNPKSVACIKAQEGTTYFAGGFYGGSTKGFLKIVETNSQNIDIDLANKVIAVWHDESHWNRYCIDNKPDVVLNSSYCYPESWKLPFTPKLLALDKNHAEVRS